MAQRRKTLIPDNLAVIEQQIFTDLNKQTNIDAAKMKEELNPINFERERNVHNFVKTKYRDKKEKARMG
jgi:hypothetical protein